MNHYWLVLALLSAFCAALIPVLAKAGLRSVHPDAATLLRSVAMTVTLLACSVGASGRAALDVLRTGPSRALLLIAGTGICGALSWICYQRALHIADVTRVAAVDKLSVPLAALLAVAFLGERPSGNQWLGIVLIVTGALLVSLPSRAGT